MISSPKLTRFFVLSLLFVTMLGGIGIYLLECDWVDVAELGKLSKVHPSVVLDEDGVEVCRFELDHRDPITYDKVPDILIKAVVAAEDHHFFDHAGISPKGIIRSAVINFVHGRVVQGASTITQQVANLMFINCKHNWLCKIREVFLAFQLERQLSKEQILEIYLNNIYFGRGIYGVGAACKRFWNKSLKDLTVAEAASLAAVAKSARFFSPLNAPLTAKKRRDVILRCMFDQKFITQAEFNAAISSKLVVVDYLGGNSIRLYVRECIHLWADNLWGKDALYHKGLRIKTTINFKAQDAAEKSFGVVLSQLRKSYGIAINGGLISIEPYTGKIRCMVGGVDFRSSQFNRAMQANRQIGSSFKPILYALAVQSGIEMDSLETDEPLELLMPSGDVWAPKNWDNKFDGPMTLVRAISTSRNTIAVKTLLKLGAENVAEFAKKFGISRGVVPYPSLALGIAEATPLENAAAFNVFANNGVYVKPYLVEWVKDEWGAKLWEASTPESYRILDSRVNSKMVNALSWRMRFDRRMVQAGWPADVDSIGKTGTTNGAATTWFVGATPELTTAVYVGLDDNRPMGDGFFASQSTFPIWLQLNRALKCNKKHFYIDPTLREKRINWFTGEEVDELDQDSVFILK